MKRILEKFDGSEHDIRQCFLFADEEKAISELDPRLLIADVDDKGRLATNPIAIYKAVACVAGARGGVELPEDAETAVKSHLERYYSKLNLESPFKSLSQDEYEALDAGELEARLKGLGISRKLATRISGLRDADRKPAQRDAAPNEDAAKLFSAAFGQLVDLAVAIKAR